MKKIAIFQTELQVGGIQRSLINLLSSLNYNNINIDLYLFSKDNFYEDTLPKEVKVIYLKALPKINKIIPINILKFFYKNQINKKYDVAIDYNGYSNDTALALINCQAKKKVMWIHQDLEIRKSMDKKYRLLYYLTKSKYHQVDTFVGVSTGVIESFQKINNIKNQKLLVIPNIIFTNNIIEKSKLKTDFKIDKKNINIVTMGRLCYQKGFDILINYFKQVTEKNDNFKLYIIGDGPDKDKLTNQIKKLSLEENVIMLGNQKNPFNIMKQMDAFVLTSRFEGQGMVILEAKTLGLPVYITKNLEKYNDNIEGYENFVEKVLNIKKRKEFDKYDLLNDYNNNILKSFEELIK